MDIINESMYLPKACLKWKKTAVTQKPSTSYIQPCATPKSHSQVSENEIMWEEVINDVHAR